MDQIINNINLLNKTKGIGFAQLIIVFFGNVYYEVILAWTLRYLYDSFSINLPWKSCLNNWNTECCSEKLLYKKNTTINNNNNDTFIQTSTNTSISATATAAAAASIKQHAANNNLTSNLTDTCSKYVDPITEYWE